MTLRTKLLNSASCIEWELLRVFVLKDWICNALVIFLPGGSIPGRSGDFTFTHEKSFVYFPTTQARIKTKVPGYGALQIKDLIFFILFSWASSFDNHFVHGNSMADNVLSKIVKFVKFYFFLGVGIYNLSTIIKHIRHTY